VAQSMHRNDLSHEHAHSVLLILQRYLPDAWKAQIIDTQIAKNVWWWSMWVSRERSNFRWCWAACAALMCLPVWAQPAAPAAASSSAPQVAQAAAPEVNTPRSPTRMQRCQAEVVSLQGSARKKTLSECLFRRVDAERIIARDCRRQVNNAALGPGEGPAMQKQCMETALQVNYAELPKRAPRPAASAPDASAASQPVADSRSKEPAAAGDIRPASLNSQ
jgi:hypothetical protein